MFRMDRRSFVHALGGAAMFSSIAAAAEGSGKKTRLYQLNFYYMRMGDQGTRLSQFLSSQLPLFRKAIPGPIGIFNTFLGPHMPSMAVLAGFPGFTELEAAMHQISGDAAYQKARGDAEQGADTPYDRIDSMLLQATDYSPEITPLAEKPKTPRIFELRVYHAPTFRQLRLVHERFAGQEIKIFHRVGVHPILYTSTLVGPNIPNLIYLTPFDSLAEREKAWDAFGADPEWIKVRKESVDRGGQIVNQISISLLRPTDYSPIQ